MSKMIFLMKFFELKDILNKREIARDTKYLIRWKDYDSKHDVWKNLSELNNAMKLIKNYENVISKIINRLLDRLLIKNNFLKKFFVSSSKSQKFTFVSSSKSQKFTFVSSKIEKKISTFKLSKTNQKIMISWKTFIDRIMIKTSSIFRQKFVVVISFKKSYTDVFTLSIIVTSKIRSIDWSIRRWWSCNSLIEIYDVDKKKKWRIQI